MPNIYKGQQITFLTKNWYAQVDVMTKIICIKNCKFVEFTQFYNIEILLQHDHFAMVKLGMLSKNRITISCMCNHISLSDFFFTWKYFPIQT